MSEALPPVWDPERDDTLVCVAVRPETEDVATFVLAAREPRLFRFSPGQFMTLDLHGAGVQRCYTIASPPTRPWRIEVTAKRSGIGSAWLHSALRPGVSVPASGPFGEFTLGVQPGGRYLFLAAGSGITPVMSMARTLHDLGSDADVLFVQSARSHADLLFADELAAMARRPGFRAVCIPGRDTPGRRWDGLRGRLSPAMLGVVAPDLLERTVFCCGPAPYMAAVRAMLDAAGFDRARYHEESFSFDATPDSSPVIARPLGRSNPEPRDAPPAGDPGLPRREERLAMTASADDAAAAFTIHFARSGRTVPCSGGVTVLAAAREAGLRLPSACTKGVCGTCKSRLLSGTVAMRHGGGIRQREIDDGLALLCCAKPTSDLVVDR